jgi:hypothetical protein
MKFYFNPITLAATDIYLDFNEGGSELTATLTAKTYRDPHELATAIATAMNAVATATITVTYSDTTGKFTIASGGATFALLWSTGTNTANTIGDKLGFTVSADDTGAVTYTSDGAFSTLAAPYTPAVDSTNFLIAKNSEMIMGSASDITCFPASEVTVEISKDPVDVLSICSDSGKADTLFNGRSCTVSISGYLTQYDVSKFKAYRANDTICWTFNGGTKSDGVNWDAGKCVNIHMPTATITEISVGDGDGIVTFEMTLTGFSNATLPEIYVNRL